MAESSFSTSSDSSMASSLTFLLYYHYIDIPSPNDLLDWHRNVCRDQLHLTGRIRISTEGLNGTLCGEHEAIQSYIYQISQLEYLQADKIDWKISKSLPHVPIDDQQFRTLSMKITKEVVSLDFTKQERLAALNAGSGLHLSPEQFHQEITKIVELKQQQQQQSSDDKNSLPLVLLDVRNAYETEIGRFEVISEKGDEVLVPVYDPLTRTFSEFKRYIDQNIDEFTNKKVLMYCTGGVRCERASAYMKSRGIHNLFQLHGGIHRYQEAYPNGGYFKGKNFVYDPRRALPYEHLSETIGKCRYCDCLFDDYSAETRCKLCRVLQLICPSCVSTSERYVQEGVVCQSCDPSLGGYSRTTPSLLTQQQQQTKE